jgi:Pro-kumamolisin, activation domain/IPT/TIG domain
MAVAGLAAVAVGLILPAAVRPAAAAVVKPGPLTRAGSLAAPGAPNGSVDEGRPLAATATSVQVVLEPSDPAGMKALLNDLYSPASPLYHRWVTPKQFDSMFGPAPATVAEAEAWLGQRGLQVSRTSTFTLTAATSTAGVDRAFGTVYHRYRTATGATGLVAQGAPLVPADLAGRVATINGLSTMPVFTPSSRQLKPGSVLTPGAHREGMVANAATACSGAASAASKYVAVTMSQLTSDYGVNALQGAGLTGSGQTVGVYELGQSSGTDVSSYKTCFGLSNPLGVVKVDGGATSDANATAEADLDIEQVATQAPGASIESFEAPNTDQAAYDLWVKIIDNYPQVKVVSTSWAYCEPDASTAGELNGSFGTLFAQAAAAGRTILAASGDSGSEGCAPDYNHGGWNALAVTYPASDPNVTAVGGTYDYSPTNQPVWNDCAGQGSNALSCALGYVFQAAGGGGESLYEPRAKGQPDVFDWPLSAGATCSPCREVPDVSANAGTPMVMYSGGQWGAGVGTSFAAPLMAGLVADRSQGCAVTPVGDFSAFLYGLYGTPGSGAGLQDVTQGENDMLADNNGWFAAGPGYDLASGLGTPKAAGLACPEVTSVSPQGAVAGQQVTVTGLGLENATIYFDSTPVTPSASTATSATVVLPSGSGYAAVSAADQFGGGTLTTTYAYQGAPPTTTTTVAPTTTTTTLPKPPPCAAAPGRTLGSAAGIAAVDIGGCDGYFVTDAAGQVAAFGSARSHGDLGAYRLSAPIIAIVATPDGQGYWLLGSDGGVFTFGDAHFYGSTGGVRLNAPVVGMAVTPDNRGYWIVAKDGGVFTFGDARFYGSTGNLKLAAPVDGIAVAPGGHGYWLVASDGGVFTFTSDGFYGSLGGIHLAKPIVGMSSTPDGRGYTLVGSDGGVFTFGDAPFYGSLGSSRLASPVVDLSPAPGNNGYYLVTSGGAVYAFGPGARYFGRV